MFTKEKLRKSLGIAVVCLLAAGLSSCGTSRKMGCPMQFGQSAVQPALQYAAGLPVREMIIAVRPVSHKPVSLNAAS